MTIQELKNEGLILFECISGSKAYGLDTPKSDTDIKGVFYLPKEQFYGLGYIEQVSNETNDEVYYELGRFVELLLKNNPNMLELLATPEACILYKHPLMDRLTVGMFLSKLCKETFAGYAITQIRKARGFKKKIVNPVAPERKGILDFCFILDGHDSRPLNEWLQEQGFTATQCGLSSIPHAKGLYALFYDQLGTLRYKGIAAGEASNEVSLSSIPKGAPLQAYLYFNQEGYSAYCKEYREYWDWVSKRNEDRYDGNVQHGKNYDAKNMMHTIRLLQVAEELLRDGVIRVKRRNREELLDIKAGKYDYDHLLHMADGLRAGIQAAYEHSSLPELPDRITIEGVLIGMRAALYQ